MLRLFFDASRGLLFSSFVCSSSSCAALAVLRVSAKNDEPLIEFLLFSNVRLCARGAKTRQAKRRQHVQKLTRPRLPKSVFCLCIFSPPTGLPHRFRQDVGKSLPRAAPEAVLAPPKERKTTLEPPNTAPGALPEPPKNAPGASPDATCSPRGRREPSRASCRPPERAFRHLFGTISTSFGAILE